MDLILNAESLQTPLTGIGLYTRHLIEELSRCEEVSSLWCYFRGRLIDAQSCLGRVDGASHDETQRRDHRLSLLQVIAGRTTLPYRLHTYRNHYLFRRQTRRLAKHCVYHDPNYILKPFRGPGVITVHDLSVLHYPDFHPKARVEHLNRNLVRSLERAAQVITDSNFVRAELLAHFSLPADKVTAIHLGVSEAFKPGTRDEVAPVLNRYHLTFRRYLLCVATHEPRKNLSRLIEAYAALPVRHRRDLPLVLVGSRGWRSADLKAKMQAHGSQGAIRSLGYVPRVDLPALYAGARVFLFPSLYEGFGLPVLEAMACGTPVVTSRGTSMTEITGDTALLVDPRELASMRDGLMALLEDEPLRNRLASMGQERAKHFTWRRCAQAHLDVYRQAPGGRDRARPLQG